MRPLSQPAELETFSTCYGVPPSAEQPIRVVLLEDELSTTMRDRARYPSGRLPAHSTMAEACLGLASLHRSLSPGHSGLMTIENILFVLFL